MFPDDDIFPFVFNGLLPFWADFESIIADFVNCVTTSR